MSKPTFLSRSFTLVAAAGLLCAAGAASAAVDTEADWQQRKSAAGVVYAESFEFASKADLLAASDGYTNNLPANEIDLDTAVKLSGAKALKLITHGAAAGNGGSWANHLDGKVGSKFTRYYFQFGIYLPRDTLAYRSKGGDGQVKYVNLEQYGAAQIVVINRKFLGFPAFMINGAPGLERKIATNGVVPNVSAEYAFQPGVDTGSPANPADACQFWERYGPTRGMAINDDYGETNPEPLLYKRNLKYGWPNQCALRGAAVPYNADGWTTIEVFVEYNTANPGASTIKSWGAPYGQQPRMFINEVNSVPLSANSDVYRRFELLNYDTPRLPEASRPTLFTYFDEIVVSTEPIKFPGGFSLPNAPTAGTRPQPPTAVRAD